MQSSCISLLYFLFDHFLGGLLIRFLIVYAYTIVAHQEKFKDVVNWLRQNQAGSTVVSSPSSLKDEKSNLPAADDSKLLVQPSSDSKQKAPIIASSSSSFQNSSLPNLFSSPSQQKTPDFSGTTIQWFLYHTLFTFTAEFSCRHIYYIFICILSMTSRYLC